MEFSAARAMTIRRIEGGIFGNLTDIDTTITPFEAGLEFAVNMEKVDFIGRDALVKWQQDGFKNKFVTLEVKNVTDADALGNNPIYNGKEVIGRATGGNYGFRVQKSLALGMVKPEFSKVGTMLKMDILGTMHDVEVIEDSPYDSENTLIRI